MHAYNAIERPHWRLRNDIGLELDMASGRRGFIFKCELVNQEGVAVELTP